MYIIVLDNGALLMHTKDTTEDVILNVLHDTDHKPLVFDKQTTGDYVGSYIATPITIEDINKKQFELHAITEVIAHLAKKEKLAACKMLMNVAGIGLCEAKELADVWTNQIQSH